MPRCDVTTIGGIPATNVSRTLVDLCAVVDEETVEIALECALRNHMTTIRRLQWRLEEIGGRGKPGCSVLRRLLAQRGAGTSPTESGLETRFARFVRRSRLPEPERQHVVKEGRELLARFDFAYPGAGLGIELHSYRYHSGRRAWLRDVERNQRLVRLGWRVLYVTWEQVVRHPEDLAGTIVELLNAPLSLPRRQAR
ncbi:hypothetical protein BH24ACT26_BH24ACT26_21460 [soil metagenome]